MTDKQGIPSAGYTSGPWCVVERPYGSGTARSIKPLVGNSPIAQIYGDPRPALENDANARLIAAAPELYEALKEATDTLESLAAENERLTEENADLRNRLSRVVAC
jgi:hypothetical protein